MDQILQYTYGKFVPVLFKDAVESKGSLVTMHLRLCDLEFPAPLDIFCSDLLYMEKGRPRCAADEEVPVFIHIEVFIKPPCCVEVFTGEENVHERYMILDEEIFEKKVF